jgi:hypothetical protein
VVVLRTFRCLKLFAFSCVEAGIDTITPFVWRRIERAHAGQRHVDQHVTRGGGRVMATGRGVLQQAFVTPGRALASRYLSQGAVLSPLQILFAGWRSRTKAARSPLTMTSAARQREL